MDGMRLLESKGHRVVVVQHLFMSILLFTCVYGNVGARTCWPGIVRGPCVYICVCPNRFSLCHLQALPPPQPQGYLHLPAVCYLKEALGKKKTQTQKFAGDMHTQAAYLTENRESVAFLTSITLPLCLPLQGMFFRQPKHSEYQQT